MRRFFGLDAPRVTLRPTPYLRGGPGGAWSSTPPGSTPSLSTSSPISASQTWAPVNTVANQDDLHELVNKIRFLASMGSEDRPLILEVCDRVHLDTTAREAIRALMHEFKHGSAAAQLSAARIWAILLRNSSAAFIAQSTAADFLEAIEALIVSSRTSPVVRHRVLRVLGDAVYSNPGREAFLALWLRVKSDDDDAQGSPYNDHDAILRPSGYSHRANAPGILDRINPQMPQLRAPDARFPYEWEAPPPSYETATGTFSSFSQSDWASMFYGSSDILLDISARQSRDEDFEFPDRSEGSDSWMLVQPSSVAEVAAPFRTPAIQISAPVEDVPVSPARPYAPQDDGSSSLSPDSFTQVTARPTAIRRLPLAQAENRSNVAAPPVASSSRSVAAVPPPRHARPRKQGMYSRSLVYLRSVASHNNNSGALTSLDCFREVMGSLTTVSCLVYALKYRETLVQISSDLGVADDPQLKSALAEDKAAVADTLLDVLYSPGDEQAVLALEGDAAQSLLDIVQDTLDNALLQTREDTSKARRLIGKLAKKCDKLPSSLIIFGVTQRDEHPSFCGGFGDVFKAMYQGKPVALKHMRMFQSTNQRDMRRKFCSEALVWQRLSHLYIVPLIGIDTESFPSSLCMVSPWMKNGTIIKYLSGVGKVSRQSTVNRLIREIAQGLAFLHDQKIVHGDLRGSNILVDDDGHACLTDFGLTVLSDATTTQTPNGAGSVAWMAPEMLNPTAFGLPNPARTAASDIYAFGCVCLELFTGFPPFHQAILYDASVILQVIEGIRPSRPAGTLSPTISGILCRNAGPTTLWTVRALLTSCSNLQCMKAVSMRQFIMMLQTPP
ncbi:kinase-like domain-containing protein [Mycena rosella]|uniref:Kinase-like domain-containing protein n=1 Tax=Mycena rosella TaxID=1033263 RepID=A0AAD7DQC9_MYCRO|nr:kinase-like domain-containing protein [Mycena rosella]